MKVNEVISCINKGKFYSLAKATQAANLHKENMLVKNFNLSKHKFFNIVTNIYKCSDGIVAVTGLTNNINKENYSKFGITAFAEKYKNERKDNYVPFYDRR